MTRLWTGLILTLACFGQERIVELTGPRIPASAVLPGASADMDLGPAPTPGSRRRVKRPQLERWARMAGAPADGLPEALTLERKMRTWSEDDAANLIRGLVAEAAGTEPEAVAVELTAYAPIRTPAGALGWSLLGLPDALDRPVKLTLRWSEEGGRTGVESRTARVRVKGRVWTAVEDMPAGAMLEPSGLALVERDRVHLRERYLSRSQMDEGLILTRNMKTGEALREELVRRPPDIERGAAVELLVVRGAVRLRAQGRAEGAGSIGDLAPIRNLATDRRVLARIVDAKTAEVVGP